MNRLAAVVTFVLLLAGCAARPSACCDSSDAGAGVEQPVLVVDSLEPIKAAFNEHADSPRVLLLVSPTCSECVYGARVVRESIMDRFAASGVQAVVVWEPMLKPDD